MIFGKPYSEYIRFQAPALGAMAAVGLVRLGLSLAGQPDSVAKYASMTALGFLGIVYYAVRVRPSGFGGYRQLLVLIFNQSLVANTVAILGIGLAAMGMANIYEVPEFKPPFARESTPLAHALAHLFIGNTMGTLFGWTFGSIVMAIFGRGKK